MRRTLRFGERLPGSGNAWALAILAGILGCIFLEGALRVPRILDEARREAAVRQRQERARRWKSAVPVGTPAPDFTLPDGAGRMRSLSEFRGKPTYLAFYTLSHRCRVLAREVQKIRRHIGPSRVFMVAVVAFGPAEAEAFRRETGDRSVFLFARRDSAVWARYGVDAGPSAWVLDRSGRVLYAMPPIETDGNPEPELAQIYEALRSVFPRRPAVEVTSGSPFLRP